MDFLCDMKHESILISPPSIKIEGERELKKKKVSFNGGNHKTGGGKMQNFIPCATWVHWLGMGILSDEFFFHWIQSSANLHQ